MIRSSKHSLVFTNLNKLERYNNFIIEYKRISQILIDHIWFNGYKDKFYDFNIKLNKFELPQFINNSNLNINFDTFLSERALSSLSTQVRGIISSVINKIKKKLWKLNNLKDISNKTRINLLNEIQTLKLAKPNLSNINPELSSKNTDYQELNNDSCFDAFISIFSIGEERGSKLNIPIKFHSQANKWKNSSRIMSSFSLGKNNITIRYEQLNKEKIKKEEGIIVGADQGMKDVLTLSNGITTPKLDNHNNSLDKICDKLSRKKKGSKSFKRASDHRKNFINWSINQLNLSNIKEIRLEEVVNINFGKRTSRKMQSWTNTIIRDKLIRYADEQEVLVIQQSSIYRSQRCCSCGNVRKANRKGKVYSCKNCSNTIDSDLNAAKNHEIDLIPIPFELRIQNLNRGKGFFWNPNGCFDFEGRELRVPASSQKV